MIFHLLRRYFDSVASIFVKSDNPHYYNIDYVELVGATCLGSSPEINLLLMRP